MNCTGLLSKHLTFLIENLHLWDIFIENEIEHFALYRNGNIKTMTFDQVSDLHFVKIGIPSSNS